jgi:PAS domain S-box-containing protein
MSDPQNLPHLVATILECIPETIVAFDNSGTIVFANSYLKTWLGFEPAEVIGKHIADLPMLTPTAKALALENFRRRMQGELPEPYDVELHSKDGSIQTAKVIAKKIVDPQFSIDIDLSIIKGKDPTEESYKFLVDNTNEYIFIVSLHGEILFANNAIYKAFGYTESEVIGKPLAMFLYPQSVIKVLPAIASAFLGNKQDTFEIYAKTKSGDYRIVENNKEIPPLINIGNIKGLLIFGRDEIGRAHV